MYEEKYIGMDVHQATISAAVMDVRGKLLMECAGNQSEHDCGVHSRIEATTLPDL